MPSIDFAQVKKIVTLQDVLDILGLQDIPRGHVVSRGRCPLGCSKDPRGCTYNFNRRLWYCHRCRQGGDQLFLVERVKGLSAYQAALTLCTLLILPVPYKPRARESRARQADWKRNAAGEKDEEEVG